MNDKMNSHSAFFYGTLMARQVLYRVCYGKSNIADDPIASLRAANLTIQPAILYDHCRHKVSGADYPGMIPQKGESVRGTYVTGLTDADLYRLDLFEGSEYRRDKVKVVLLGDGKDNVAADAEKVDTETYIYIAGDERLEKGEWDFDSFVRDKMPGRWASDSSEEYNGLDDGPDTTGGRGINTDMSNRLQHDAEHTETEKDS